MFHIGYSYFPYLAVHYFSLMYLLCWLFLTSPCLVGSFALGQGFDELVNGHDAIQTDVIENNQPTGPLVCIKHICKGQNSNLEMFK